MNEIKETCTCGCCGGTAKDVLLGGKTGAVETVGPGMSRSTFLKTLAAGAIGLTTLSALPESASAAEDTRIVKGGKDVMIVDKTAREIRISSTVTKDVSKPSIADWGRRFQAFFGAKGGKMEAFFVFTTEVSRLDIDKAIRELGIQTRKQIPMSEVEQRRGLKATTTIDDYLDGDPVICMIRFEKNGQIVEAALEDFIMEKIMVDGAEVIKPYTPHFIYHGTGEAINFPSGCIVCPSDCNGGIITDNVMPLKTTVNYYKINWDRMPEVGARAEVVLKSIYGPQPMKTVTG
ncbi:MAG: hypothetical protein KKE62_17930 [Proteobacteria bacterium]|nr:hypothetical protein [Pseudomonadota bacterium]MBU1386771.1 hypothetical protein [Pseudomonadota bacterium]MBU1544715.1 hypothetical protein [Pseudomonadota bacterium]MBU2431160.1 hypothetical protein [Pseudomonadota bacterium]MBU2481866.1 hypothetical protein [Pseudomonadota bacterium]